MLLVQKSHLLLLFLVVVASQLSAGLKPYLPEPAPVTPYQSATIPVNQLQIPLHEGLNLVPGKYVSRRSLNGQWKCSGLENSGKPFAVDADFNKNYNKTNFDDSKWDDITVPLDWYRKYPKIRKLDKGKKTCSKPFIKGWYRKKINITADELANRNVILHFDVAAYEGVLFINGKEAGRHHGDFTPWDINITRFLKAGNNTIALRLLSDFGPRFNAIGKAEWTAAGTLVARGQIKATHAYGSQWGISNIKGGLWQNVSLRFEPQIYFSRFLVNPKLQNSAIDIDYVIENPTEKTLEVKIGGTVVSAMKKTGPIQIGNDVAANLIKLIPGTNSGSLRIRLEHPEQWSPSNPFLYYAALYLLRNNKIISADTARFGFREFKIVGRNFFLNGKRIYLFGENLPAVRYGGKGDSEAKERASLVKALQGFKSLGYNILRNPHMPIVPVTLELADEIGIMFLDEWAWCFTKQLDEPVFEKINLTEITEWVYRDYNHPSVVIWCGANEVVFKNNPTVARQLDKQVELIRQLDKSKRPVSSFSATGSWTHYGKEKRLTDLIDLHNYLGLSTAPWTCWDERFQHLYDGTVQSYGKDGKLNMPYIIWECVGFSWGMKADTRFALNDIHKYAEYAGKSFSWAMPNGIGFSGMLGLDAALDPKRGTSYGRRLYGRRILEQIRYNNTEIQGFAPWFQDYKINMATLWNQPVFCGMRNPGSIMLRNAFAGREYIQDFFIVNSSNNDYTNLKFDLQLVLSDGKSVPLMNSVADNVKAWDRFNKKIKFAVPAGCPIGWHQIRICVKNDDQEISRNYYNLFLQTSDILTRPVKSEVRIAVIDAGTQEDIESLMNIMRDLKINATKRSAGEKLADYDLIIIPPTAGTTKISNMHMGNLREFVRHGKTMLILEQGIEGMAFSHGTMLVGADNTFVDLIIPAHPIFKGLSQKNFDTWNNPSHGFSINNMMMPFSINALAVRGPLFGERNVGNAIAEGKFGEGRVLSSQLCAVRLWGKDASASTYLRNLLEYMVVPSKFFSQVFPLEQGIRKTYIVDAKKMVPINLRPYTNRSFTDDKANDNKGGWTDQGANDFRIMPLGRQTLAGVPFEIIDSTKNNDTSCLILKGIHCPTFPSEIKIKIGKKFSRLFFLHTSAWNSDLGQQTALYHINYEDGTHTEMKLINGINIADWWNCDFLPEAKLAISQMNSMKHKIGAVATVWENPYPYKKIVSLDFVSNGNAVPILIAVTGEVPHDNPLVLENGRGGAWKSIAWKGGEKPQISVINSPDSPGKKAIKVVMPAKDGHGTPVIMKRFPVDKLTNNKYKYFTFRIKSEGAGMLDIVLPVAKWGGRIQNSVSLSDKRGKWTQIRFDIQEDLGMKLVKRWNLTNLDGELFIYNGLSGNRPACTFYIDDIRFE